MSNKSLRSTQLFFLGAVLALSGCAGIQSSRVSSDSIVEGIAYYMPMRYFVLTVERANGASVKADWAVSDIFPDTSQQYSLQFNPHLIGKTEITIAVNSIGLLGSAKTKVSDSAAALASVTRVPGFAAKGVASRTCATNGTEVFIFDEAKTSTVCGDVIIAIEPLPSPKIESTKTAVKIADAGTTNNFAFGVFYRQERPYIVEATFANTTQSKIVLASNNSPVIFLPYARTLFASNDGQVTFSNGIPTNFDQSTDGEFVALLKTPAVILQAYFSAVGNVFDAFSSRETDKQANALERYKLAVAAYKLDKCKDAFDRKDDTAMKTLECDKLSAP